MCDHFLESLNGMSMNDTKILKTKTAEMGIRILFMINKRFHTIRYCYNYLQLCLLLLYSYYDSVTGGSLWIRHFGRHLGPLLGITLVWSVDHIASHPRTECSSSPQPIPLGEVGLRQFCETRGGGGGIKGLFATRNSLT